MTDLQSKVEEKIADGIRADGWNLDRDELIASVGKALDAWPALREALKDEWIPVADRLPEEGRRVLAVNSAGYMTTVTDVFFSDKNKCWVGLDETPEEVSKPIGDITYWRALPPAPKEDGR